MLQLPNKGKFHQFQFSLFSNTHGKQERTVEGENACYLKFGASHKDLIFEMVPMSLGTGLMHG